MPRPAILPITAETFTTLRTNDVVHIGVSDYPFRVLEICENIVYLQRSGKPAGSVHWSELHVSMIYERGYGLILTAHRERLRNGGA